MLLQERIHGQVLREGSVLSEEEEQEVHRGEQLPLSETCLSEDVSGTVSWRGGLLQGWKIFQIVVLKLTNMSLYLLIKTLWYEILTEINFISAS